MIKLRGMPNPSLSATWTADITDVFKRLSFLYQLGVTFSNSWPTEF